MSFEERIGDPIGKAFIEKIYEAIKMGGPGMRVLRNAYSGCNLLSREGKMEVIGIHIEKIVFSDLF